LNDEKASILVLRSSLNWVSRTQLQRLVPGVTKQQLSNIIAQLQKSGLLIASSTEQVRTSNTGESVAATGKGL
jgi:DNA-binding HxlR family transcriptional regulator